METPYSPTSAGAAPYHEGLLPPFRSSASKAFKAVLETPNWVANLLWLSLAAMLSSVLIGQIAIMGYGTEILERRSGRPENPGTEIDSNRLGDYINKGVWPFLVQFVVQIAASFLMSIPAMVLFGIVAAVGAASEEAAAGALFLVMIPGMILLTVFVNIFTVPFVIRGMVAQDFAQAFDFGWCLNFTKMMWGEIIISSILFAILAMLVSIAGLIACFVGIIPASGLVAGAAVNLLGQWYEIYLSRGGPPVPTNDVIDASIV